MLELLEMMCYAYALELHEQFGFGAERCERIAKAAIERVHKCISRVLHGMGTNDVTGEDATNMETCCADFKDKALRIELPCRLGEKIYMIVTKRPRVYCEEFSFIKVSKLTYINLERAVKDFGKTVFLSREDAERALANLKKEKEK